MKTGTSSLEYFPNNVENYCQLALGGLENPTRELLIKAQAQGI